MLSVPLKSHQDKSSGRPNTGALEASEKAGQERGCQFRRSPLDGDSGKNRANGIVKADKNLGNDQTWILERRKVELKRE